MRVLYIEDSSADADLARRVLARSAPQVELTHADTLARGLEYLAESEPFDLVLCDLALPDGSGLEVLSHVRENGLPIAVVMLTGSGDQDSAVAALKAGADDYLVKRNDYLDHLADSIDAALARRRGAADWQGRGLRVLYVEHNGFDADLLARHLAEHAPHIRLTVSSTADEALDLLPAGPDESTAFDVILTDYRLPGMDGLELVRTLRRVRRLDLPIVLITGQGSEDLAAKALGMGIDDYLAKHEGYLFEVAAILEKVQRQAELKRERETLRATSDRLSRLIDASPTILYSLSLDAGVPRATWVSENITRHLGYTVSEALQPGWWASKLHADDRAAAIARSASLSAIESLVHEYRFADAHGQTRWIRDQLRLVRAADGQPQEAVGVWLDVTTEKRDEVLQRARVAVLDEVLSGRALADILADLARRLEELDQDMLVSILLIDTDGKLHTAAAPSLPADYNAAVDGLTPGEGHGSCGTAAWLGKPVIVSEIEHHPYWQPYLAIARKAGLAACWSIPLKDDTGRVIGTFGIYHRRPRAPGAAELALMEEFGRLTSLAIIKVRDREALKQAAAVFSATRDGVFITDLQPRIVAVNRAFSEITGYAETEALGRNPSMLQSGRHERSFFQSLWKTLGETGHWHGEVWNRRKSGEIYPQWLSISTVKDDKGEPHRYVGVFTDIGELKSFEARLEHLAHHDPLTDLPNRLLMQSRLQNAIDRAERHGNKVAVLYLDLDRFKTVNDSLGHPVGDELLVQLTQRLSSRLRDEDTLARLGGDEFLLLVESVTQPGHAVAVAQSLIELLHTPFALPSGHEVFIGLSIGISLYPDDALTATELVQHADAAMYLAKQQGRNTYRFHTHALTRAAAERLSLETRLRHGLDRGEFLLHYQPLVDATTGKALGVEALVRWQPPGEDLVPPGRFIPLTEETGLIVRLGAFVLRAACVQAQAWREQGLALGTVAVNLSARQFMDDGLVEEVKTALAISGLPPHCLELELTESLLMEQAPRTIATLSALKQLGLRLAIDDFGTGYSSLAYIKRFSIDKLKIDQSFVRSLERSADDKAIVATIVAMARTLRLEVLAEGVETDAQASILASLGCVEHQGYLYARPLPPAELETWLRSHGR